MPKKDKFFPDWRTNPPPPKSYRNIFKWGAADKYKHPNHNLYQTIKEVFELDDDYFKAPKSTGDEKVKLDNHPINLAPDAINKMKKICGEQNVESDDYTRLYYSCGKTMEEALMLREGKIPAVCDLVVHPRCGEEISQIVKYCNDNKIPLQVYGGGSSVTFGLLPEKGGITLVMQTHMNKVLEVNELDQTCRVQPGIMGPDYEKQLNTAENNFGTTHNYTCGHFPQSFQYSTVGGWVVTLGSGQQSSYYGDIYDIVFSQKYATPRGIIETENFPSCANGPKINDIMKGSEGAYGILIEVKLKIFKYMPQNRQRFGFIFNSFSDAVDFGREIFQGEFGKPSVFRISDEEETDIGLKLYGIDQSVVDKYIRLRGYKPEDRSLVLGHTEGEKSYSKNVKKNIVRLSKNYDCMSITGYGTKQWEHGRYRDPYLREILGDYNILIDTLETSVRWSNLHHVHQKVRQVVKSRPKTICMTHASHFYPQGTNLYFIFIIQTDKIKEYHDFQTKIIDAVVKNGGSISHHHGVGRMLAPWMKDFHGPVNMGILQTVKDYLDPNHILNPGKTLGLDNSTETTTPK